MFNPDQFLQSATTEANDTKKVPCPVGEYIAVAEKVEARQWQSKDGTKSGIALDITWSIDDPSVKEVVGRDNVQVRQGLMLDLLESGGLDMGKGKNIALGRVREAVGLNTPGQPFSPSMIQGRTAKVTVSHRVDGEDIYDEIKKVAALS
jgi:hypothetical protein